MNNIIKPAEFNRPRRVNPVTKTVYVGDERKPVQVEFKKKKKSKVDIEV